MVQSVLVAIKQIKINDFLNTLKKLKRTFPSSSFNDATAFPFCNFIRGGDCPSQDTAECGGGLAFKYNKALRPVM